MQSIFFSVSVFFAGILSFFSPCILPLLPVYVGVLLDSDDTRVLRFLGLEIAWYGLVKTLCFIGGLSMVFITLGYGAGVLGNILYTDWFRYLLGGMVILLGIHQMEVINIKGLQKQKTVSFQGIQDRSELSQAFLLGLTFSFGWTPCVGPILSSVLAIAASGGSGAFQGAFLMFLYTLGLAIPFLLMALASSFVLKHFSRLKPYMGILKKIGGGIIILMGILLMAGNFNMISQFFG